jgi:hypothetical protein
MGFVVIQCPSQEFLLHSSPESAPWQDGARAVSNLAGLPSAVAMPKPMAYASRCGKAWAPMA